MWLRRQRALTLFGYEGHEVRVVVGKDGNPWFVLNEAAGIMNLQVGIVLRRLKPEGVSEIHLLDRRGAKQLHKIINEANLYRLILRSNKPEAEAFQDWVVEEVLPATDGGMKR